MPNQEKAIHNGPSLFTHHTLLSKHNQFICMQEGNKILEVGCNTPPRPKSGKGGLKSKVSSTGEQKEFRAITTSIHLKETMPECIFNPITALWFSAMFIFHLDNIASCRYVWAMLGAMCVCVGGWGC